MDLQNVKIKFFHRAVPERRNVKYVSKIHEYCTKNKYILNIDIILYIHVHMYTYIHACRGGGGVGHAHVQALRNLI